MGSFYGIFRLGTILIAITLFLGALGSIGTPAQAQGAAALIAEGAKAEKNKHLSKDLATVRTDDLKALAKTLENDDARKKFIGTLKALIVAREATRKKPAKPGIGEGIPARITGTMSRSIEALGRQITAVIGVLRDAPRLVPWAGAHITNAKKRDWLIGLIWRFIIIVALGMALQYLFRKATGSRRSSIEENQGDGVGGRAIQFALRTLLLFGSALAYGAGAYGGLLVLPMSGTDGEVLLVGASSFFVAKLILATTRMIVAPGIPLLRPLPVSDQTANYLYLWVRRLVRIFVYAFFFLKAAQLMGLPDSAYWSLIYLVGLVLVSFLMVFVLQNRAPVAAVIHGRGEVASSCGALRARLAGTWHLFAMIYIVAVYAVWAFKVEGGFEFLMVATFWTIIVIAAAKVLVMGGSRGIARLFAVGAELEASFPGLEVRANRYVPALKRIIGWVVYIGSTLVVLDVWGVDTLGWLASENGALALRKAVTVAFILMVAIIVWEAINLAIGRYLDRMDDDAKGASRARTLLPLMRTTSLIIISAIVCLSILSEVGFNIGPLLAGAGVIGLAIGFGSQKLVQDIITGLFILLEDTLAVGDAVRLDADHSGLVEELSLRSVRLRDLSGNVHTLPFSEVKTILNMTKDWSYYVFEVGVAYRENVDHVMAVLDELGAELKADPYYGPLIMEPLEVLGLDKFADSAIIIKARIKVKPPLKQWAVGREFNRLMKTRFEAEGIEIPFPHQTIYFGEDREGAAPPAHVTMMDEAQTKAAAPGAAATAIPTRRRRGRTAGNVEDGEGDL